MNIDIEPILSKRNITKEVYERYGVRSFYNDGNDNASVGFPLVDANGVVTSYHYRTIDLKEGKLTREFRYDKGKKVKVPLFGWQLVNKNTKKIIICEGETDALALATITDDKSTVVMGAVGTGFAHKVASWLIARCSKLEIVLAFDNDKPGREATTKVAAMMSEKGITVSQLKFKAGDVSDAIAAGESLEQAPIINTIFLDDKGVADQWEEHVGRIKNQEVFRPIFSETLSSLAFYPGDVVGVIGTSGCGKSTLVEHLLLDCLKPKIPACMVSAEMSAYQVGQKLLSCIEAKDYCNDEQFMHMNDEEIADISKRIESVCNRFYITDNVGAYSIEEIERNILELSASGNHPRLVVIDHLLAISGSIQTLDIEETVKKLKQVARRCNTAIVIICHIRKPPNGQSPDRYHPHMSDAFNSDALPRYASFILGVSLNRESGRMRVSTVKVPRMGGGKYFDVEFTYKNWQLHEVKEDAVKDSSFEFDESDDDGYDSY